MNGTDWDETSFCKWKGKELSRYFDFNFVSGNTNRLSISRYEASRINEFFT